MTVTYDLCGYIGPPIPINYHVVEFFQFTIVEFVLYNVGFKTICYKIVSIKETYILNI